MDDNPPSYQTSDSHVRQWRPHPWHGLPVGPDPPLRLCAYIEMTPFDLVKNEIDKESGYLRIDRLQRTSSLSPTPYGFIPRTYCGKRTASHTEDCSDGDHDPLDICVISERPISRAEIIAYVRTIGGIRTLDNGQADDKILSVLEGDPIWGQAEHIGDLPGPIIDRLCHYFSSYKVMPDQDNPVQLLGTYDRDEAMQVVRAAMKDYESEYGSSE